MRFLLLLLVAASCGGGGAGPVLFVLNGSVPSDGALAASTVDGVVVTFNRPVDLVSINGATMRLERIDGTPVGTQLIPQGAATTTVRIAPLVPLLPNTRYRLTLGAGIRSVDGLELGAPSEFCFLTESGGPTVRPDQLIDLGDRLNVARYLARAVTVGGRVFVIGGFVDDQTATDTIEEWIPATRTFQMLPARLGAPRAEHSATLLADGRILIAGGVSTPGGAPLASTDVFDPGSGGIQAGPDLNVARRWHGASSYRAGESVMVSGGFGAGGDELDTAEFLSGGRWFFVTATLPRPTAQHVQWGFEFDQVYFGSSNNDGIGGLFDGQTITMRQEPDIRYRAQALISFGKLLIVGGDTRSAGIYDFTTDFTKLASNLSHERRGAHSLTPRDGEGTRFLMAGGFNIARFDDPPLDSLEIVEYLAGPNDVQFYEVLNVPLPVPFAGHVGFNQPDGATILAGGWGGETGPHLRRVVLVHDDRSAPTLDCR